MRDYMASYFKEFEYSEHERITITLAYERILACAEARARLYSMIAAYDADVNAIDGDDVAILESISSLVGVHLYTVELVAMICLSRKLRERLVALGVPKKSVFLTVIDPLYHMREHEKIYGIVGTSTWRWFVSFLKLRIIAFGRLQFELTEFAGESYYRKKNKIIKKRAPVLSVHIPSNDAPLLERACLSAYKQAHEFFTRLLGVDDIPFVCSSWLLYPLNRGILPENSNIVKFMNQFDIIQVKDYETNANRGFALVFLKPADTPLSDLPRDTVLRAGYAAHLENGGSMGIGYGVRFLENENDTV